MVYFLAKYSTSDLELPKRSDGIIRICDDFRDFKKLHEACPTHRIPATLTRFNFCDFGLKVCDSVWQHVVIILFIWILRVLDAGVQYISNKCAFQQTSINEYVTIIRKWSHTRRQPTKLLLNCAQH